MTPTDPIVEPYNWTVRDTEAGVKVTFTDRRCTWIATVEVDEDDRLEVADRLDTGSHRIVPADGYRVRLSDDDARRLAASLRSRPYRFTDAAVALTGVGSGRAVN